MQVDFSDMVTFKTEVEVDASVLSRTDFILKVDLMFMEASEEDIKIPVRLP